VQSTQPIVVRVLEEPVKSTGVGDIILGALGLTGVMLLAALLLGALLGGILITIKRLRAKYDLEPVSDHEALRVTPSSSTPYPVRRAGAHPPPPCWHVARDAARSTLHVGPHVAPSHVARRTWLIPLSPTPPLGRL
jgi:hypothetical protein